MTEKMCGMPENDGEKMRKAREWQRKGAESQRMTAKICGKPEMTEKMCGKPENDREKVRTESQRQRGCEQI
jgi:hypothetical protein